MVWTEYHTLQYTIGNPICPPLHLRPILNFPQTWAKKKKLLQIKGKDDIVDLSGEDQKENRYLKLLNKVVRAGVKTKVLMLSATPVNNRFNDLKNQLALAYEGTPELMDDNDNVQSGEENSVEESVFETSNNNSILRWILSGVAVLLLILGAAYGGYLYGRYELSEEIAYKQMKADLKTAEITTKKAQVAIKKDSVAQEVDATKIGAMSIDNKDESANDEAKTETAKTSSDKYEDMDIRVRTGAYRIIGEDRTVKAKAGQTVEDIATKLLGPGMSCYVEVYNGLDGKATLKEGQTIKIPKLELKKRR